MKILKSSLKQIIREELSKVLSEQTFVGPSRKEIRGLSQSEADKIYGQYLRAGSPSNYDPTDLMNKALNRGSVSGDFVQDAVEYGDTNYPKTTTAIETFFPFAGPVASLARLRATNTPEEEIEARKDFYTGVGMDVALSPLVGAGLATAGVEKAIERAAGRLAPAGSQAFDTVAQAAARKFLPKATEKIGTELVGKVAEKPVEAGLKIAIDKAYSTPEPLEPLPTTSRIAQK